MEAIRKYLLRVHGTSLMLVGIAAGINATLGAWYGKGSYSFLQTDKVGYIGLLQAYLLAMLTGIVLWTGSYIENRKKWNRIGCLFHFFCLLFTHFIGISLPHCPVVKLPGILGLHFTSSFLLWNFGQGFLQKLLNHDRKIFMDSGVIAFYYSRRHPFAVHFFYQ